MGRSEGDVTRLVESIRVRFGGEPRNILSSFIECIVALRRNLPGHSCHVFFCFAYFFFLFIRRNSPSLSVTPLLRPRSRIFSSLRTTFPGNTHAGPPPFLHLFPNWLREKKTSSIFHSRDYLRSRKIKYYSTRSYRSIRLWNINNNVKSKTWENNESRNEL